MTEQIKVRGSFQINDTKTNGGQIDSKRQSKLSCIQETNVLKHQLSNSKNKYEEFDEFDEDNFNPPKFNIKNMKPPILQSQFSKNSDQARVFEYMEDEEDKVHQGPLMFQQAKYVMKPLDQFVEEQSKAQKAQIAAKHGLSPLSSLKDKLIGQKSGSHHLPYGFNKLGSPSSNKSQTMYDSSPQKQLQKGSLTQRGDTSFSNLNQSLATKHTNQMSAMNQTSASTRMDTQESDDNPQIKNIFNDNVDLKQKNVTPLFDTGPRYDKNDQLVRYSIVGKPEWYRKIDQQKNGSKLTHMNMKQAIQNTHRPSIMSGTKTITLPYNSQNFDMKSVLSISKQRKNTKLNTDGNGNSAERNQTMTKDHLLMKYGELEKRIQQNNEKDIQELNSARFQVRIDSTRQERSIKRFDEQRDEWLNTAQSLLVRQDPTQALLGKSQSAQNAYTKYKNYTRQNVEDTLLLRSEDIYRYKKEQGEYLEHLKDPFEYIGQKNLWESMLRNDTIDITTKYSQKKRLDNYFFPKQNNLTESKEYENKNSISLNNLKTETQIPQDENKNVKQQKNDIQSTDKLTSMHSLASPQKIGGSDSKKVHINQQSFTMLGEEQQSKQANQASKSILKQQSLPKSANKIDLTFRKSDQTVRELSYTNGVRIQTALNHENLQVVRTPRLHHDPGQFSSSLTTKNSTMKDSQNQTLNSTKGFGKTLNTSTYFLEREKEQTTKYGSIMKKPYLDYFTQSDLDTMALFGENKLQIEKNSLLNDGKQRFETYQFVKQSDNDKDPITSPTKSAINTAPITRANSIHTKAVQNGQQPLIKQSNLSRITRLKRNKKRKQIKIAHQKLKSKSEI